VTEVVENFYALASLALIGAVAGVLVAAIGQLSGRRWLEPIASALDGLELWVAFAVAAFAMAGSLYFSEVAHFTPCVLCWYQRIAMYPLVPLMLLAAIRRDRGAALYGLVFAGVGAVVALYHYQLEWFPDQAAICKQGSLCHVIWFRALGFATIPYLSLVAFCAVGTVCAIGLRNNRRAPAQAQSRL
jgi:disulfide bond formation protein DsbB